MRRVVSVIAVGAFMAAATAVPAFAAPSSDNGCGVGFAVAPATQQLGGLGKAAHELGFNNVGNQVIQPFHQGVMDSCHAS